MKKTKARSAQVKFSWGILLGMLVMPVLALMIKVFPQQMLVWQGLMVAAGLVIVRCVIGYVLAGSPVKENPAHKQHPDAVTQAHG